MAEKILNTRIQLKYDTLSNWTTKNTLLKQGEIAIAVISTIDPANKQHPPVMFKVGPGNFNDLDWASALAADVYGWAKESSINVTANGTGNVVASITWDASLNGGKGGIKYETASVATSEGLANLQKDLEALEEVVHDMYTNSQIDAAIAEAKSGAEATAATELEEAKTAISAEIDADVKIVNDALENYKTSNDAALAGVKTTAEAARTESQVNSQIDAKITALNLGTTYEPIGAEQNAKDYVDQKFTDANLAQYTTEQEVKDIVDGVIAGAADSETYNSLTKLVDYIDAHGGEASEMAQAIDTLEGKVDTIEKKPAYGITETQISNWGNEVGAKALAETKLDESVFTEYNNAHAGDYTNKQIDDAIDADVKTAIDAEVLRANAAYDTKGAAADALIQAQAYADGLDYAMGTRVAALEKIDHTLYAEKADLAAIATSGNVNDLIQTAGDVLILDCGGAE